MTHFTAFDLVITLGLLCSAGSFLELIGIPELAIKLQDFLDYNSDPNYILIFLKNGIADPIL